MCSRYQMRNVCMNPEDKSDTISIEELIAAEGDLPMLPGMTRAEAGAYAPLTLAFIGDAVYELLIRTLLVREAERRPNELNRASSALARAAAQSDAMEVIEPRLTKEESDVYRRGRNAKSHTMAKHATVTDYRRATGFEALVGYLYLSGQIKRLLEIVRIGIQYEREMR